MDHNFTWRTREEKQQVVAYWWRQQTGVCFICKDREQLMEPYSQAAISPWAASIEHLIPKRDNGPDTVGNVRLAHRWCNNVLGALWQINQDRAKYDLPPLSAEWALSKRRITLGAAIDPVRAALKSDELRKERGAAWRHVNAKHPKASRGTLWRAIENGETPLPRGATLPKEPTLTAVYKHSAFKEPEKLTGLELARFLRDHAVKNGQRWPLA